MDKVKIGQIGLGFMGTTHYRIHNSLPYAQVTAVADVEEEKRKGDISSVIGNIGNDDNSKPLDFSNVEVYDDPLEMIQKADIDIVDITVPTPWHAEYIL
ncbi:MAG: Gfo/Idh/MocA family oxidoreductase, partial [Victivallales bacterium]|nr:Gfo/Idh/MocA family oxidoreductase [Victivallales bacterium]